MWRDRIEKKNCLYLTNALIIYLNAAKIIDFTVIKQEGEDNSQKSLISL